MSEEEVERLQQIAKDAQIGHFAPHLGLATDAERLHFLAFQLERSLDLIESLFEARESLVQ
jgi:hypothetical protein